MQKGISGTEKEAYFGSYYNSPRQGTEVHNVM